MTRQIVGVEWHIGEEAYLRGVAAGREPSATLGVKNSAQPELVFLLQISRWLVCIGIAFGLATSVGLSPQQDAVNQAYNGVYAWIDAEENARRLDDKDGYDALLDPNISSGWRREWRINLSANALNQDQPLRTLTSLSLDSGLVQTSLTVTGPPTEWWRSTPYRETHFFRKGEAGLLRTIPNDSFWGEYRTLENAHVQLEFYERDGRLAESLAAPLEAIYLELYNVLALDLDEIEKVTIVIDNELSRGWASVRNRQALASPFLSKIPSELSDHDYMLQRITGRLSYMALNAAMPNTNRTYLAQWETLIWSLDGWLRTDLLQQRTPWHRQAEALLRDNPPESRPLKLTQIGPWRSQGVPEQSELMVQYMIAESAVAYLIEVYGREQIPMLLDGLAAHGNWSDLVNDLYGLPLETVEANWNAYLAERFEWPPID